MVALPCGERCDTDASGTINATDALRILARAVGRAVELVCPDPVPEPRVRFENTQYCDGAVDFTQLSAYDSEPSVFPDVYWSTRSGRTTEYGTIASPTLERFAVDPFQCDHGAMSFDGVFTLGQDGSYRMRVEGDGVAQPWTFAIYREQDGQRIEVERFPLALE